jgi:hypothetical protein
MTDMLMRGITVNFTGPFVPALTIQQSFQLLREAFTLVPVLVDFDPAKQIRFKTDTSACVIARIILQQAEDTRDRAKGAGRDKGKGCVKKGH